MKKTIFVIFLFVLLISCGESKNPPRFTYPNYDDVVTTASEFKLVYTGDNSGISYYIKPMTEEMAELIHDDNIASDFLIEGENQSFLYVAIKDSEIVMKPPISDIVGLGYKLSQSGQE